MLHWMRSGGEQNPSQLTY